MHYDPLKHHRRSVRLKGYDYAQAGAYYVTLVTRNRDCLFGDIVDGEMHLNDIGRIVGEEWLRTAEVRPAVELDEFIVMPNHVHGIIVIADARCAMGRDTVPRRGAAPLRPYHPQHNVRPNVQSNSLGAIVRSFKSATTYHINALRDTRGVSVWQRNYYEHIIRRERELDRIREYIINNPPNWVMDENNVNKRKTSHPRATQ